MNYLNKPVPCHHWWWIQDEAVDFLDVIRQLNDPQFCFEQLVLQAATNPRVTERQTKKIVHATMCVCFKQYNDNYVCCEYLVEPHRNVLIILIVWYICFHVMFLHFYK